MAVRSAVRHFEAAAARYDALRNGGMLGTLRRRELAALRQLAPVRAGERVLDAGCGDGELLAWLAARGARAVGVDAARGMAAACRRRGLAVAVQDMEQLGVRPAFDWTLCIGSLEFAADPRRAVAELAATLRPGGRFVLLYPRREPLGLLYAAYHRLHGVRVTLFSRAEIGALFRAAGLSGPRGWRDCALSTLCVAERPEG
jgi:SAM-dependent methyltransferase